MSDYNVGINDKQLNIMIARSSEALRKYGGGLPGGIQECVEALQAWLQMEWMGDELVKEDDDEQG